MLAQYKLIFKMVIIKGTVLTTAELREKEASRKVKRRKRETRTRRSNTIGEDKRRDRRSY